jgi:glutathionylspermidine synthase
MNELLAATDPLTDAQWKEVRKRSIFECCKWDIQAEDQSTLADFALVLQQETWHTLAAWAERLTAEALDAEAELLSHPKLQRRLELPKAIRKILSASSPETQPASAARVMRFDFHFTTDGWRISEVNADVPGGFIESSGFTELMAEYYPDFVSPESPTKIYAEAIAARARTNALVALVHATAHSDDAQVMHYLGTELQKHGLQTVLTGPEHLQWEFGEARVDSNFSGSETPHVLVRFFPAEWLPNLRQREQWSPWFRGGRTMMSNPATAILLQSKRFPLAWPEMKTSLTCWKSTLPETKCPSEVSGDSANWVFKPVFGRVGEDLGIAGLTESEEFMAIVAQARRHPESWVMQRRFQAVAVETPRGPRFPCLGVFTVAGCAAGIYGRIAAKPLIDQAAQDVAVLLRREGQ